MDELINYGALGVFVVAMAGYIKYLHKLWKEDRDNNLQAWKDIGERSTRAIEGHTSAVSSLKTLLESLERRLK